MTRPSMTRPSNYPLSKALMAVLQTIDIGADQDGYELMPVGWGIAPNAPLPYLVLTSFSSREGEGPMNDIQADTPDIYQISAFGESAQQAEAALSLSRIALTKLALQTALDEETNGVDDRHIMFIMGTLNGQLFRDERGMPEPVFGVFDQITIKTTPK